MTHKVMALIDAILAVVCLVLALASLWYSTMLAICFFISCLTFMLQALTWRAMAPRARRQTYVAPSD